MKIKLKRKTAKKGGSVLVTKDLDSPLSLTVPPGTKSGDCLFRGMLRKKNGRDVADEYTEIYASVKWFRWWFIPAAIILLTILCNMDCGGKKEENSKSSASKATVASSAEATSASSESEHEEFVYEVVSSPVEVQELSDEEYQTIIDNCYRIEEAYLTDGAVPVEKAAEVRDKEWEYAKSIVQAGKAVKCANSQTGFTMLFPEGNVFAYCIKIEGLMSGGGVEKIAVVLPYDSENRDSTIINPKSILTSAEKLSNNYSGYSLSNADILVDSEADLKSIVKAIEGASVILWQGHGGEDGDVDETGKKSCYLCVLGSYDELKNDPVYAQDCFGNACIYNLGHGEVGITPEFFKRHFSYDSFPNALVYLAACYSGKDSRMAEAFIQCGAQVVIGYKSYSHFVYAGNMCNDFMDHMMEGSTAGEALSMAGANLANYPPADNIMAGLTWIPFVDYEDERTWPAIFGNSNYILCNEFLYYLDGEHAYEFTGTVIENEDGSYMLALDSFYTGRSQKTQVHFCNIRVREEDKEKFKGLEQEKKTVIGSLMYLNGQVCFSVGVSPLDYIDADPGRNVEIIDIEPDKTYNKLIDFLGESFDKVQEYYGVSEGVIGLDENGECLSYLIDDNYIIFAELYEGTGTVNEIQVIFRNSNAPELLLCSGVSSHMKQADVHSALSEYHSEAHVTSDALTVNASSETANLFFSWNPAATGSMSFVRLEAIR